MYKRVVNLKVHDNSEHKYYLVFMLITAPLPQIYQNHLILVDYMKKEWHTVKNKKINKKINVSNILILNNKN